jgi:hypothetical protein
MESTRLVKTEMSQQKKDFQLLQISSNIYVG